MARKLTTIVAADIAGFSRLVGVDEEGLLARLRAIRAEITDPLIARHGGRIANTAGDSLLVEFPSTVEAVRCAIAVQDAVRDREDALPEDRRIRFRIGVNLGDVIAEGADLLGDGVNVAARLEALAPPGGIVMSRSVRDQMRDRLKVSLHDLGDIRVRNIARPIRAFQVAQDGQPPIRPPRGGLRRALAAALVALIVVSAGAYWWAQRPDFAPADPEKMTYAPDEQPSIAVLAFDNLTGDPQQEYLSDGISEDIIAELARLPGVLVIARNSSFVYKGEPVDIRKIAEEQSVRYVLEGSLQQSEDVIRVTAQLVDAISGHHVWAKKFDRPRREFFTLRDGIVHEIIAELNRNLIDAGGGWRGARLFDSIDTWLLARKAVWRSRQWNRADNRIAIALAHQILATEPDSAWAHMELAFRHATIGRLGWTDDRRAALGQAEIHAEKAVELDPGFEGGHISLAWIRLAQGRLAEGIAEGEKALALAPGDSVTLGILALVYQKDMQADRAIELFQRAVRVDGRSAGWVWENYGEALLMAGRHAAAVPVYLRGLENSRGFIATEIHLGLAVAYDALGKAEDARRAIGDAVMATPDVTVAYMRNFQRYKDQAYKDRWLATLARLGLPEA